MNRWHDVPAATITAATRGTLAVEGPGATPVRLPGWAFGQMAERFSRIVTRHAAGARLDLTTAAGSLELTVRLTRYLSVSTERQSGRSVFAVVDTGGAPVTVATAAGSLERELPDGSVAFEDDGPVVVRFDLGAAAGTPRRVQLWLPHNSAVTIVGLRADAPVTAYDGERGPVWLHHGSSISHCLDAASPLDRWPAIAARGLGLELVDLGFAGNAMLDPYVARAIRDASADLITLKVGINIVNGDALTQRTLVPALHGFLDTVRDGHPGTPLVVVSPVFCGIHEHTPGPTLQDPVTGTCRAAGTGTLDLATVRTLVEAVARERQESDPALFVLDGRELLSADDASTLWDDLHPDETGYRRIGERFAALATMHTGQLARAFQRVGEAVAPG
ncbi:MAG: SGNH/GDSL hydrolase family protein [Propionicimonas sp.]|nr:SGNH/GDSL hydrolase family protein [Propionicimonas sp.]